MAWKRLTIKKGPSIFKDVNDPVFDSEQFKRYYVGVVVLYRDSRNLKLSEMPLQWFRLSKDLTHAIEHDKLDGQIMLDKLINVPVQRTNRYNPEKLSIRVGRVVSIAVSDELHMKRQLNLRTQKRVPSVRSQWIEPESLLSEFVEDRVVYMQHDYSEASKRVIRNDLVDWQRLLAQYGYVAKHDLVRDVQRFRLTRNEMKRHYANVQ